MVQCIVSHNIHTAITAICMLRRETVNLSQAMQLQSPNYMQLARHLTIIVGEGFGAIFGFVLLERCNIYLLKYFVKIEVLLLGNLAL